MAMANSAGAGSGRLLDGRKETLAVACVTIALSVLLVGPRAAPFMLALILAAIAVVQPSSLWPARKSPWPPATAAAATLGAYLLINATWSAALAEGIGKAALFCVITVGLSLAWIWLPQVDSGSLRRIIRAAIVAVAVALAYLLIEELSNHVIKRTFFNLHPALRPDKKHVTVDGEIVSHIALYVSNRNMAAVNFVLWPVLLAVTTLQKGWRGLAAGAVLVAVAAVAMLRSQHETSVIALAASLVVFAVARVAPRVMLGLVAAGWTIATLLMVPMVDSAYKAGLYTDMRLPMSARHRVILWGYTAEQVPARLWRGVGIDATKPLDAARTHEQPADHNYPRRTGTHAHNIYLQTWYELGAIGAVLMLGLGLSVLAGIRRLEAGVRPHALAAFTGAATIGAFSWGMWQPWYMAGFAISMLLMLMMAELARRPSPQ